MHNFYDQKARSRSDLLAANLKEEAWDCVTPDTCMHVCQDDLTSQFLYSFFLFLISTCNIEQKKTLQLECKQF